MNVEKFTSIITKDPGRRISTARFRQAAATLWVKTDQINGELFYIPSLTHCGNFIVDWGGIGGCALSERSRNQLRGIKRSAKSAWLEKLAGPPEMNYPFPAPCLRFNYPAGQLAVKKPNAAALSMLLKGKHPDNGTTRQDWRQCNTWDNPLSSRRHLEETEKFMSECGMLQPYREWREGPIERAHKASFKKPFEEAIQALAYGAIKKENVLKTMTQPLGSIVQNLFESSGRASNTLKECSQRYFAPENLESAGLGTSHLHKLAGKMRDFATHSTICESASRIFYDVCLAPDSVPAIVTMSESEAWDITYESKMGPFNTNACQSRYWMDDSYDAEHSGLASEQVRPSGGWWALLEVEANRADTPDDVTEFVVEQGEEETHRILKDHYSGNNAVFTDHNIKAFSYYWVQRNMKTYASVLRRTGHDDLITELFGEHPDDWDYAKIAAPLFLKDKSS